MHDLPEKELRETLQQLRDTEQVVRLAVDDGLGESMFPGLVSAIEGRPASAKAIANEIGTDSIFLGMMLQEKTKAQVLQIVQQTLARGEKILADKVKPDDREEVLAGENFGVVFMPPELLRQLWGLGEAVVHFQEGKSESKRVEPRAINVMMLAAQWVRDARTRWGLPDRVEKVEVAPLLKEPPMEPPF
jgi:hypothetical protein